MASTLVDGVVSLGELSALYSGLTEQCGVEHNGIPKLMECLRSAKAIASSFRRSGDGPPDFILLSSVISILASRGMGASIMDALSAGLAVADITVDVDDAVSGTWVLVTLAAALPLLQGALPKDKQGVCVLPHEHRMQEHHADLEDGVTPEIFSGVVVYNTRRMCDRCMAHIHDRVYFHCDEGCDVDFCLRCHEELQGVMDEFIQSDDQSGGLGCAPPELAAERMLWSVHITDQLAHHILSRSPADRKALAEMIAREWSIELFQNLTRSVVDVCNARILYNDSRGALTTSVECVHDESHRPRYAQQVSPIYDDIQFWCSIGFLQFMYAANSILQEQVVDGHELRGPKIPCTEFVLEGIKKCKPQIEWQRWVQHNVKSNAIDVLSAETVLCCEGFRSLIAHNNLLPISFRRSCLLTDLWLQMEGQYTDGNLKAIELCAERERSALVENVIEAFSRTSAAEVTAPQTDTDQTQVLQLRQPLRVTFKDEEARGPGVLREFFRVALRAFLAALFVPGDQRSYWFSDTQQRPEALFACGVLLGQAVLHNESVPQVFPRTFFELLLRDFSSPHIVPLNLAHLAAVSPAEAKSLQHVLDYQESDIGSVFGDLGWERTQRLDGQELTQASKTSFVNAYVTWSLTDRLVGQFDKFSEGFRAVLGESVMLREMVDAIQLEKIICGSEEPVDVAALRHRAQLEGWGEDDNEYIAVFWDAINALDEASRRRFLLFLTASDCVPLEGWDHLRLVIQKNGEGDERLPTAFTCFHLLLLPKYSSANVLRGKLDSAISNSEGFGLQ